MKKQNLILAIMCIIAMPLISNAQAFKYDLIHHFGNAGCGICATQNPVFKSTILNPNTGKIHHIKVPTSFPYFDPMYAAIPVLCDSLMNYYKITSVPTAVQNGNFKKSVLSSVTQSDVNTINLQSSPVTVLVSHTTSGQTRTVNVEIKNVSTATLATGYVLQLAVVERVITYLVAPGGNGEKVFPDVLRAQFPANNGYTGQVITLPAPGMTSTYTFTYTLNNTWVASQIEEIAYVQNTASKEVMNSGASYDCQINSVLSSTSIAICQGSTATIQTNAGNGNTYVWEKSGVVIPNAISANYSTTVSGDYTVEISNGSCTAYSTKSKVTVNPIPSAVTLSQTGIVNICSGKSLNVTVTNPIGTNSYSWLKNNITIPLATATNYTITTTGKYKARATNEFGCVSTSAVVDAKVTSASSVNVIPAGPLTMCAGDSMLLTASNNANHTYQWKRNNINVSNATALNYYARQSGNYKVIVTNINGCTKVSNTVAITINCREANAFNNIEQGISLYPNPADNRITIEIGNLDISTFKVLNSTGQIMQLEILPVDFENGTYELNTAEMKSGFYIIQCNDQNGKTIVSKFQVIHE
nr:Omp28-related outer membrane protein [Bacteroidota bacterium]